MENVNFDHENKLSDYRASYNASESSADAAFAQIERQVSQQLNNPK